MPGGRALYEQGYRRRVERGKARDVRPCDLDVRVLDRDAGADELPPAVNDDVADPAVRGDDRLVFEVAQALARRVEHRALADLQGAGIGARDGVPLFVEERDHRDEGGAGRHDAVVQHIAPYDEAQRAGDRRNLERLEIALALLPERERRTVRAEVERKVRVRRQTVVGEVGERRAAYGRVVIGGEARRQVQAGTG